MVQFKNLQLVPGRRTALVELSGFRTMCPLMVGEAIKICSTSLNSLNSGGNEPNTCPPCEEPLQGIAGAKPVPIHPSALASWPDIRAPLGQLTLGHFALPLIWTTIPYSSDLLHWILGSKVSFSSISSNSSPNCLSKPI